MNRTRKTVADLLAMKGQRQLSMIHVESVDEVHAAAAAAIDLLSIEPDIWTPATRQAAGDCFVFVPLLYDSYVTTEDYLRGAHRMLGIGADAIYCAASPRTIRRMREEGIPVCGHAGLIPARRTWTCGFRAVGRTAQSALQVYEQVKELELAGAFATEIEVVPASVTAEIARRTSLLILSMGGGTEGVDAQYLFSSDILGYTAGHITRHATVYRDFRAEYKRLQDERIDAFREFARDVGAGSYPDGDRHLVSIDDVELRRFRELLATQPRPEQDVARLIGSQG